MLEPCGYNQIVARANGLYQSFAHAPGCPGYCHSDHIYACCFIVGCSAPRVTPGKLRFEFVEEAFYTIKPAFASGRVLAIGLQRLFQILQQLSLLVGKLDRRFNDNAA